MAILAAYLLLGAFPVAEQDAYLMLAELAIEAGALWGWAILGTLRQGNHHDPLGC